MGWFTPVTMGRWARSRPVPGGRCEGEGGGGCEGVPGPAGGEAGPGLQGDREEYGGDGEQGGARIDIHPF